MITALRPGTFSSIQLNAGAFLVNFDYSDAADSVTLQALITAAIKAGTTKTLGATRGGGTFSLTPTVRNIEADGKRGEFFDRATGSGSTVNDGYTCNMTGTLLEFDENTFVALGGMVDPDNSKPFIKHLLFPTEFTESNYIENLVWVSNLGKNKVLLIDLKNALNTAGVTFTFTDKGEGTLPFTFVAHSGSVEDIDLAPAEVYIFEKAAV